MAEDTSLPCNNLALDVLKENFSQHELYDIMYNEKPFKYGGATYQLKKINFDF
ncbi:MAG: hypothetical protein ACOC1K_08135 [Nanoarchaeota archaeon]